MMKNTNRTAISVLLTASLILGCAGTPKYMEQEDINNIERLAIVTFLSDEELKVMDHTKVTGRSYGGGAQFGGIGALIEVIVIAAQQSDAIKSSLGGKPDALREEVRDFPVKRLLDEGISEMYSMDCEIINPQEVEVLGIKEFSERKALKGETINDYTELAERLGADTILEIEFVYGLAAYEGEKASSAITAEVSVIDVREQRLLMKKQISSDIYYKCGHSVDEFEANGAELFKTEIVEAIRGFTRLLAAEFGAEVPHKEKSAGGTETHSSRMID